MSEIHQYTNNLPSRMNKDEFVTCFGGVYEHSPWITEKAWGENGTKTNQNTQNLKNPSTKT